MSEWVKVGSAGEIPENGCLKVEVDGEPVAVFNVQGDLHAIHNTCLHQGGPLADGNLMGATVTCPWHFWEFDVTTGACRTNEALSVRRYDVKVEDGQVLVAA